MTPAILATPYIYAQHYSSTVVLACYMSKATILRSHGEDKVKTVGKLRFRVLLG